MELDRSYLDFAEDDFQYLHEDFQRGRVANYMASMAVNIVERYLKHVIDCYAEPIDDNEFAIKSYALHTQNLERLAKYVQAHTALHFSEQEMQDLRGIAGYYFSTRYPGDDCIVVDADVIARCMKTTEMCRDRVLQFCKKQDVATIKSF